MEARILFQVDLDYERTAYKTLAGLAVSKALWSSQKKKFEWIFKVEDLDKVIAAIAKPITFKESEVGVKKIVELCPPILKMIPGGRLKGEGEYSFREPLDKPNIFLCGEWQKDPRTNIPKQHWTPIPKESVLDIWKILLKYPLNKKIKGRTIAEHLCREKGFDRFFRESGTFLWDRWWGGHRKTHMKYVYWPFKILQHLGAVDYDKTGKVARIKESFEFQTHFEKI